MSSACCSATCTRYCVYMRCVEGKEEERGEVGGLWAALRCRCCHLPVCVVAWLGSQVRIKDAAMPTEYSFAFAYTDPSKVRRQAGRPRLASRATQMHGQKSAFANCSGQHCRHGVGSDAASPKASSGINAAGQELS